MNIPPNSNQPIQSNDPTQPPSDPTNAPIKNMPSDVMGHIISFLKDQEKQEVATTAKPLTNITVDQAKQSSLEEIKEFTKNLSLLIDKLEGTHVDKEKIEELKTVKQEILAFHGGQVLGVNLLDLKSSMTDVKFNLASLISKVLKINDGTEIPLDVKTDLANLINKFSKITPAISVDQLFGRGKFEEISEVRVWGAPAKASTTADAVLELAELYRSRDKILSKPFELFPTRSLIKGLTQSGDLPEALKIGSLFSAGLSSSNNLDFFDKFSLWDDNFSGLEGREISDSMLDQLDKIVEEFPDSYFKNKCLSLLELKRDENRNVENETLDEI